jgi:hypothetical protein
MKQEEAQINFQLSAALKKEIKVFCSNEGITVRQFFLMAIDRQLKASQKQSQAA